MTDRYSVRNNLVLQFKRDTIDQSPQLAETLFNRFGRDGELEFSRQVPLRTQGRRGVRACVCSNKACAESIQVPCQLFLPHMLLPICLIFWCFLRSTHGGSESFPGRDSSSRVVSRIPFSLHAALFGSCVPPSSSRVFSACLSLCSLFYPLFMSPSPHSLPPGKRRYHPLSPRTAPAVVETNLPPPSTRPLPS